MNRPATVRGFGGGEIEVAPKMWAHFMGEARKEMAWAKRAMKAPRWRETMCRISVDAVDRAVKSTVEQLAADKLRYIAMRATYESSSGYPIARPERDLWCKLGGKLPRRACEGEGLS